MGKFVKIKKILRYTLLFLGVFILVGGISSFFVLKDEYHEATKILKKTYKKTESVSGDVLAIDKSKPMTILLMGVDTGSSQRQNDWQGNSDTMLLVTINPATKRTSMTSLERDLMTEIDGKGRAKLNAAYAAGGADLAISTIQKMLDIDIDYYALINMKGLISLVDAVGGIEVTNHFDFPISIAKNEPEFQAVVEPGTHTINGEQALVYSRMRYDDPDGDYGRQKRQREVIQKIIQKIINLDSINNYQMILSVVSTNIQTNINLGETSTLISLLDYKTAASNISSYQLAGNGAMVDGVSYQLASSEDIYQTQNRIRKELGLPGVEKTALKTNLVISGDTSSRYTSESYSDPEGKNNRTMADIVNNK